MVCAFSSQMAAVDGDNEEDTIHCATCGVQISVKKAMVHMEKCFMKVSLLLTALIAFQHACVLPVGGKRIIWRCSEE